MVTTIKLGDLVRTTSGKHYTVTAVRGRKGFHLTPLGPGRATSALRVDLVRSAQLLRFYNLIRLGRRRLLTLRLHEPARSAFILAREALQAAQERIDDSRAELRYAGEVLRNNANIFENETGGPLDA